MLAAVFPEKEYPKAYRISNNGGPPGCAMAFGSALRRMGGHRIDNKVFLPPETDKEVAARAFEGMPWRGQNEPPQIHR